MYTNDYVYASEEKSNDAQRRGHYTRFMSVRSGLDVRDINGHTSTMEIDDGYVPNIQYRPVGGREVDEGTPRHWEFYDRDGGSARRMVYAGEVIDRPEAEHILYGRPACEGFGNRSPDYWNMKEYGATSTGGQRLDDMFPQDAVVPRFPFQSELWGRVYY